MIQRALEPENWRAVPGFEGYYEVSDLGRVRSCDRIVTERRGRSRTMRGRIIRPAFRGYYRAYPYVALWVNGKRTTMYVYQLVLRAFVGAPEPGQQASHEPDPDPSNCRLSNLRWRTGAQNRMERDLRAGGVDWAEIEALLEDESREPGYSEEPSSPNIPDYDPVLTGETPF